MLPNVMRQVYILYILFYVRNTMHANFILWLNLIKKIFEGTYSVGQKDLFLARSNGIIDWIPIALTLNVSKPYDKKLKSTSIFLVLSRKSPKHISYAANLTPVLWYHPTSMKSNLIGGEYLK